MVMVLIIYVDDIVVIEDDLEEIERLKKHLATKFEIKDLGRLRYFLGIEVTPSNKSIFISQQKYVLDLLKEIEMLRHKPTNIPFEQNHKLMNDKDEVVVDHGTYQRPMRKLIYLSYTKVFCFLAK